MNRQERRRKRRKGAIHVLKDDERQEYLRRYQAMELKRLEVEEKKQELIALAAHWDQYGTYLMEEYGLPGRIDVDFSTGQIFPVAESGDGEVAASG